LQKELNWNFVSFIDVLIVKHGLKIERPRFTQHVRSLLLYNVQSVELLLPVGVTHELTGQRVWEQLQVCRE